VGNIKINKKRVIELLFMTLLLACAAALYYYPPRWAADLNPDPDGGEYATTALRLLRGEGFHIVLQGVSYPSRYPFGFPLIIVSFYVVFGSFLGNAIIAVFVGSIGSVISIYLIARKFVSPAASLVAGGVVLSSAAYLSWSTRIMSDYMSVLLFTTLYLVVYRVLEKKIFSVISSVTIVVSSAFLIWMRFVDLPLVACAMLLLVFCGIGRTIDRWYILVAIGALLVGTIPLLIYNYNTFGGIFSNGYLFWVPYWYQDIHKTFSPEYVEPNISYYIEAIRQNTAVSFFFLVLAVIGLVRIFWERARYSFEQHALIVLIFLSSVWYILSYCFYFFHSERFIIPLLPAIAVFTAIAIGTPQTHHTLTIPRWRTDAFLRIQGAAVVLFVCGGFQSYPLVVSQSYLYTEKIVQAHPRRTWRYDVVQTFLPSCAQRCVFISPDPPTYANAFSPGTITINPNDNSEYSNAIIGKTANSLSKEEKHQIITDALRNGVPIFYDTRVVTGKSELYMWMLTTGQQLLVRDEGNLAVFRLVAP